MKKPLVSFLFSLLFIASSLSAEIYESDDIRDLLYYADEDTLVVSDLNHVLMQTTQPLGSDHWAGHLVKKWMKETGETKLEVLHQLVPIWHHILMESTFKAVEPTTAGVIRKLQQNGNKVVGLTARYTEMAYPTIQQLHSIGIDLSLESLDMFDHEIEGGFASKYVEGVIFVGLKNDKGETLMRVLHKLNIHPKKILFIDDKEKNLISVQKACQKAGIAFTGLRYGFLDEAGKDFDHVEAEKAFQAYKEKHAKERADRIERADMEADRLELH